MKQQENTVKNQASMIWKLWQKINYPDELNKNRMY